MKVMTVAIVGRPNVGKSSLFNRLFGKKRALVHDMPGVTRDRLIEITEWWIRAKPYTVQIIDTGGLEGDRFADEIQDQVNLALESASIVLFVVDGQMGIHPDDMHVLRSLKKAGIFENKLVFGVVNKIDSDGHSPRLDDFHKLKLPSLHPISAEHNLGIDDLKEKIIERVRDERPESLESDAEAEKWNEAPRIAIIGKPNVGKSTLINHLLGEHRMVVSPIAGTTVDAVDSLIQWGDHPVVLIDTAGIRRRSKTEQGVEVLSVIQSQKAVERADLAILVLDGEEGPTDQDEKIAGIIEANGCSVIILVNKWDTQKRSGKGFSQAEARDRIYEQMAFIRYAPMIFGSALKGRGFEDLKALVFDVLEQKKVKLSTKELTEWAKRAIDIHNPKDAKVYMAHQSGRHPPTFVFHVNDPAKIHFSLERHLVNVIRERWGYMGSPIRMVFVKGKNSTK